jgi:hypothetical protein
MALYNEVMLTQIPTRGAVGSLDLYLQIGPTFEVLFIAHCPLTLHKQLDMGQLVYIHYPYVLILCKTKEN